jgi:hypothetical protein
VTLSVPVDSCVNDDSLVLVGLGATLDIVGVDETGAVELDVMGQVELGISSSLDVVVVEAGTTSVVEDIIGEGTAAVVTVSELDVVSWVVIITLELMVESTNSTPNSALATSPGSSPSPPKKTNTRPISST